MKNKLFIGSVLILAFVLPACIVPPAPPPAPPQVNVPKVDVDVTVVVPAGAAEPTTIEPSSSVTVAVTQSDEYGFFLVDGDGMSLYVFKDDPTDTSTCYNNCADNWPPLITEDLPIAGEGVDSTLLGTIGRDDGTIQVTYNGHPLYYFYLDSNRGDVKGQGAQDSWYLFSPVGEMIT
jgi:predicted lipoprotein with Yx(FWY)xxD motif